MPLIKTLNPDKQLKKDLPEFSTGDIVKVHQRIKEVSEAGKERERIQIFEGLVIARKHGIGTNASFTVRKIASGVGVERIFPLHAPGIEKIEVVRKQAVTRSKLYYVRDRANSQPRVRKVKAAAKAKA
jgi:large subunit ribosomal protein L19